MANTIFVCGVWVLLAEFHPDKIANGAAAIVWAICLVIGVVLDVVRVMRFVRHESSRSK